MFMEVGLLAKEALTHAPKEDKYSKVSEIGTTRNLVIND